jgi:3-oxoacyl-[acyl-carrier protein] reductase
MSESNGDAGSRKSYSGILAERMNMKISFKGQVVLITGATRGIGKQLADDFVKSGAQVILTGTQREQIDMLNKSVEKKSQGKKMYYCVDFTDSISTQDFIEKLGRYRKIDVCINNAGINRVDYIHEIQLKDWDDIMAVNLKAPFLIIREVSKIMKRNRYGRIVNISSIFGIINRHKRSIYSASKFGIRGLTVAASNELARYNILVNTVSPGFVLTDLTRRILSKKEIQDIKKQIPQGRFATPDEISCLILFLASPSNTYLTGQNIIIDGGYVNV